MNGQVFTCSPQRICDISHMQFSAYEIYRICDLVLNEYMQFTFIYMMRMRVMKNEGVDEHDDDEYEGEGVDEREVVDEDEGEGVDDGEDEADEQ